MGNLLLIISSLTTLTLFAVSKTVLPLQPVWQVLAQVSGIIGLFFMCWAFVLSARHRKLELLFSGLDKVYKLHHLLGGVSYLLLINHPVFLILNRLPQNTLKLYLFPGSVLSYNFGIVALYFLTLLIVLTIFADLPYRIWKWTHEWMGFVILLGGLHSLLVISDISRFAPLRYWMLFWVITAVAGAFYKRFLYYFLQRSDNYKVLDVKIHKDIFYLTITQADNQYPIYFQPGQYAFLSLGGSRDEHPFTVMRQIGRDVTFAIKVFGHFTQRLSDVKSGSLLTLRGPFGSFASSLTQAPQVWIAGGIGITPFVSMLNQITPSQQVTLFWSCKDDSLRDIETIFRNFDNRHSNFKLISVNTCTEKHISVGMLQELGLVSNRHRYSLCGPIGMMTGITDQLISSGIKRKYINYEDFSFK